MSHERERSVETGRNSDSSEPPSSVNASRDPPREHPLKETRPLETPSEEVRIRDARSKRQPRRPESDSSPGWTVSPENRRSSRSPDLTPDELASDHSSSVTHVSVKSRSTSKSLDSRHDIPIEKVRLRDQQAQINALAESMRQVASTVQRLEQAFIGVTDTPVRKARTSAPHVPLSARDRKST
jgi:hypothetical protein